MARPKAKAPSLRYHLSGQSVVTLSGRDFYLGRHDSPDALARYAVLISVYQAGGLTLPDDFEIESIDARVAAILADSPSVALTAHQSESVVLVRHITAFYRDRMIEKYPRKEQERYRHDQVIDKLESMFGNVPATDFGPVKLREFRGDLVTNGLPHKPTKGKKAKRKPLSRKYVNRLTNCVIGMFKHAVAGELIDVAKVQQLKSLEPLREHDTSAPEKARVTAANLADVQATAEHLSPIVKSMLRIQIATGMRPGELCIVRPCDVDRGSKVWIYVPSRHKTSWRGKAKAIPIIGDAREALTEYLHRYPEAFCFSPIEAMQWRRAVGAAKRVTPMNEGNRPGTNRKESPQRLPRQRYDSASYRQAIQRAQKKAGVAHWFPYQLRHLSATVIRAALGGTEEAQALLGHSTALMTEHYAQKSIEAAIEAAKVAPNL